MPSQLNMYTGPSAIAGTGCFAAKSFRKGETIGEYTGEYIGDEEADKRYEERHGVTYLFEIEDGLYIDGDTEDNPAKYINHSCEPNCETEQKGKRIFIKAITSIEKDAELTYDYRLQVDEGEEDSHPCVCGSRDCRGTQAQPEDEEE